MVLRSKSVGEQGVAGLRRTFKKEPLGNQGLFWYEEGLIYGFAILAIHVFCRNDKRS
jgi:hypothetical protein